MIIRNDSGTNIALQDEITMLRQRIAGLERMLYEQQQVSDRLCEQVEMFTQTLDILPDMVLIKGAGSRIVYANSAFRELYGMSQEELRNSIDAPFNEPDYTAQYIKDDAYVFTTGQTLVIPDEPVTRHDGVVRRCQTVKAPIRNSAGEVVKIVGICHDITEEQRLQAQHEQFFKLSVDMLCIAGTDGYLKRLNPAWEQTLGFTNEELCAEPFLHFVHPDDQETTLAVTQALITGENVAAFENRYRCKDGGYVYLEWTFTPLDEQGMIYGVARNITERKRVEEELRLAQFTLDHSADGIHWLDPHGNQRYVNEALCGILGYARDELLALCIQEIDPRFAGEEWRVAWNEVKAQGSATFETSLRHKDGRLIAVEVTASYLEFHDQSYVCSSIRDITARKQAEDELRMFRTLAEMAPDSIAFATPNGSITYANPAHCAAIGYGADETRIVLTDEYAEDPAYILSLVQQCIKEGTWRGVLTYKRRDGSTFPGQLSAMTIRDDHGQLLGVAGIIRDITEIQRAEAERAALQQQIIEAQRHAIHELSTPLIPIADKVVIMPLVGSIDTTRAQQMMDMLLSGIAAHHAESVILDITGVQVVDTQVANSFIRAAQAARLLGAQVILTGIQPQIAQTLVQLGVDLSTITTRSTLQAGIRHALAQLTSAWR